MDESWRLTPTRDLFGPDTDLGSVGCLRGSLTTRSLERSWMLPVGMSPVQWTDKTPPDLLAEGPHLIWEQEAAGSNPAIPTGQGLVTG